MVVFPRLESEPRLLNITELIHKLEDEDIHQNRKKSLGQSFSTDTAQDQGHKNLHHYYNQFGTKENNLTMSPGKDNMAFTLSVSDLENSINSMDTTKLELPTDSFTTEPDIVKKIAAGLKICGIGSEKQSDEKCLEPSSLSCGSSIVTITSAISNNDEPESEPGFPNNNDNAPKKKRKLITDETCCDTAFQISIPFFIAGIGTIGAGLVLNQVTQWPVFKEVGQILILVPALLGLKGNLDMCLASRMSTQANLGNMKGCREIVKMIIGNIALVQIQAIVAATLVACFATIVGYAVNGTFSWEHSLLMIASSVCTATSSCFILDFVMIGVIMGAKKLRMNPDNLATPIAASIGDVVSISVLSTIASKLYIRINNNEIWILYVILLGYLIILPVWIVIVLKNKYTKKVLTSGWTPVISALFISGLGGLILDKANDLKGFAIFSPIVNGIGGNLVSVQASRISTMLHQTSPLIGLLPTNTKTWVSPWKAIFRGVPSAKTARILIMMSIPGHLVFSLTADYVANQKSTVHAYFVLSYLAVSVMQIMILLYIAHIMIHVMWKYKIDPDNSAIPYLTALGDLTGSMFLALAFLFLKSIHHEYGNTDDITKMI